MMSGKCRGGKMSETAKEVTLEFLIELAKRENIKRLRFNNIEFEFDVPKQPIVDDMDLTPKTLADQMPGDDEMLLYSTPHFDELRAERETGVQVEGTS